MRWRVLWQSGPLDQGKEGVQYNRSSILVGWSPILSGNHPLHLKKKILVLEKGRVN